MRNSLCNCHAFELWWHPALPRRCYAPFLPIRTLQLRDRMEALSTTNDLARAISHFDEASVLALLKQARAWLG